MSTLSSFVSIPLYPSQPPPPQTPGGGGSFLAVAAAAVQSNVQQRWNDYILVQLTFKTFPRNVGFAELNKNKTIRVNGELGKGEYGIVYDCNVSCRQEQIRRVAIKIVTTPDNPTKRELTLARMLREEIACAYLNSLVFLRVCPNFVLVHKSFLSRHTKKENIFCFLLSMEKADGNFRQWTKEKAAVFREPFNFMQCMFQIFIAMVVYGTYIDMVHNDLYLKNILYNNIPKTTFVYQFRGRKYYLNRCEVLLKISDLGICSSLQYLKNSHKDMCNIASTKRHASSLVDYDFAHHVLEYTSIPAFCRDAVTVLRSVGFISYLHPACKAWIGESLALLDARRPDTAAKLGDYVEAIFHRECLAKCGISPNIFESCGDEADDVFQVDMLEESKRAMIFMTNDYINASQCLVSGPATPATFATPSTQNIFK